KEGGYAHYQEKVEGNKVRSRSVTFNDHFSQVKMFWNSMSKPEKQHIIDAFSFELGRVKSMAIRQQVVDMYAKADLGLAAAFAKNIGAQVPTSGGLNITKGSPALSQENTTKTAATRLVGVILDNGFNDADVKEILHGLNAQGMKYHVISEQQGTVKGANGEDM